MTWLKRLLTDAAIALPVGIVGAVLLTPRIGIWRTFLIVTLTPVLVIMFVHRHPQKDPP